MSDGLQYDPAEAIAQISRSDRRMGRLIRRAGEFRLEPPRRRQPFDSLLKSITYQQLSGHVAKKIHGRLLERLPPRAALRPQAVMELSEEDLRAAGVSRAKAASIKDLAARTLDGTVPKLAQLRKMDDEEIIQRLTAVRGIGPWTVQMMLMFHLGRPDVLPVADYGVRKGFMLTYRTEALPRPAEMTKQAEKWRPYRSVGSWYLWRAIDLAEGS